MVAFKKDLQYYKFCFYGFFKNLKFFEPFLILFLLEKGLSFLEIGALYSIREVLRNIFEVPSGLIADILGRRRTLIQSFFFYIASFVLFYFSNSYALLALAMAVFAFGDAFRTGTNKAMIITYLKQHNWEHEKVYYYGHTRSYSQLGSALSSLIAAGIVFISGEYETIFLCATIPYLLDLLLVASYPKSLDQNTNKTGTLNFKELVASTLKAFLQNFKNKPAFKTLLNLSAHTGYFRAIKDYLQPIILGVAISSPFMLDFNEQERTAILIGIIYFVIYLTTSFFTRRSGNISAVFKSQKHAMNTSGIIGFLAGGVAGLLFYLNLPLFSIATFVLIFIIENLRKPLGISLISDYFNKQTLATSLSVESQTNSLVAAIIAPAIGLLADSLGIGAAIAIISTLLLLSFPFYKLKS